MANSPSGESMINRVVRVLAAFTDEEPAIHLRQLAREVDLPLSTAHRLVAELEMEGLLERDPIGRLRHGYRLWELANRGSRAAGIREAALPAMEDLSTHTGHHVSLGVREGTDVLYIERLTSDDSTVNITRIAGRLPLHGCSGGLVFMAHAREAEQGRFLQRRLEKLTGATVTDPEKLRALLASTRLLGYCSMAGIIVEESSGISVPIFASPDEVVACLTVIVPLGKENLAAIIPALKMTSRAITRRLGYEPAAPMLRHRSLPFPD
ncbi:hypothetical protein B5P43_32775 [Bacillus sp. SRB_336]|nr:hypothetical protein B5P43_32775 [Bacillus sp. SRB_336]